MQWQCSSFMERIGLQLSVLIFLVIELLGNSEANNMKTLFTCSMSLLLQRFVNIVCSWKYLPSYFLSIFNIFLLEISLPLLFQFTKRCCMMESPSCAFGASCLKWILNLIFINMLKEIVYVCQGFSSTALQTLGLDNPLLWGMSCGL